MNFRFKALQRMREPDELDSPTLLAAPRGWIAVFVVMIIMAGATLWAFQGSLPISVSAPGLLTRPLGSASVQSPVPGTVRRVLVHVKGTVAEGQPVATIEGADGRSTDVTSPFSGHVVGLGVSQGQVVPAGSSVATVERTDASDDRMVAMVFVPAARAVGLAPGKSVDLSVSTAPPRSFGLLRGRISSVSPYPLTSGELSGLVGGELAARSYVSTSPPRLVVVDLVKDAGTTSGYAWSTTNGPPSPLSTQVSVKATINLGSQTPFNLILGR
ncbi:HlyD family efflux transporter periplasmic adaptor subunit [Streptomyces sp. NPDC051320]|uniref:HlyD family efflux transporter periplasmic adaptor subunit n=1 Tax=Streptomyces sp. NPDC051320 TaxID=3154644 RepID=UPI00342A1856